MSVGGCSSCGNVASPGVQAQYVSSAPKPVSATAVSAPVAEVQSVPPAGTGDFVNVSA